MAVAVNRLASEADFLFSIEGASADDLRVTRFAGSEAVSTLFHFRVDLCSRDAEVDLDAVIGRPCTLTLLGSAETRYVSGMVRRFERTGRGSSLSHYAAEIVPVHWYLTQRHKSRIFQTHNCDDMTVPGIVRKVLQDAGIPEDNYRLALESEYTPHEFIVQYRETDMNFISRLLERAGLHFFFEHSAAGHVMVIADGAVAHVDAPGCETLPFRSPDGLVADSDHVFALREARQLHVGAVSLDAFNFKRPPTQLRVDRKGDTLTALEFSDYPGGYTERSDGEDYAQIRLEEHQARRHTTQMHTGARGLLPGTVFTLTDHPVADVNREYLVLGVEHQAAQPQSGDEEHVVDDGGTRYEAVIRAIPADVAYRPPCVTPQPRVAGSQTALVVGPPGEEIWTDEYGRIKVQFHWDQEGQYNEDSSCWIRVSQGWAGGNYGILFLPRVGQEVVVDFLEGDPNLPLVTGSVYNNDNMPPYKLPDEKTRSTIKSRSTTGGGGANEIRFEDRKDAEQLLIHAEKDLHVRAKNDRVENVGNDRHLTVAGNRHELVKKSTHSEVTLDLKQKVGGNQYLEVGGDVGEDVKGNHSEGVGGKYYLNASGEIVLESSAGICLKVGGNFITINSSGVYVMGTVVHLNGVGSALNATAVAARAPEAPAEADTVEPGRDVTYAADARQYDQVDAATADAAGVETTAQTEQLTSWIEIELVDEAGRPYAGEAYEIIEPDGSTKRTGSLNRQGQAHVGVSDPGECQISFPRLDRRAWSRTRESQPQPIPDDGTTTPPPTGSPGQTPGDTPADTQPSDQPHWVPVAEAEVGVKEIAGDQHNARVLEYHATTGGFSDDETPWCSSFVNWVMTQAGYTGTNSALAISWADWGQKVAQPGYGAIAAIRWNDPPDTSGHVGFVVGKDGGNVQLLGGNQSDQVKVSSYGTDKIIAYVYPTDYQIPDDAFDLGPYAGPTDQGDFDSTR